MKLYLATSHGVTVAENNGGWRIVRTGLDEQHVTSITASYSYVEAGTTNGLYCSVDGGQTWREDNQGLQIRHIRWIDLHREYELVGTEPAGIFVLWDDGDGWHSIPEVSSLRDQFHWSLPYSPEAGCVRGFAMHGSRAYAAVEVGGVLVSNDFGAHWELARGSSGEPSVANIPASFIHPDVHSILVHPSSPDEVFAPTGGGFYRSNDGGTTWKLLYRCYCRAVWVDPGDIDHIVLGPADWVDRNGRIEESRDGGNSWTNPFHELDTPWPRNMVERFTQVGNQLFAVLSGGDLLASSLPEIKWSRVLPELDGVNAVYGVLD
jgi:hypothetical protein